MTRSPQMLATVLGLTWLVGLVVGAPFVFGEDNAPLTDAQRASIPRLIEKLDAESFADREAASRELVEIGEPAVTLLDAAVQDGSPEVRKRAAAILRRINRPVMQAGFLELARQPDEKIDLEQGMWFISRILNPRVRRADLDRPLDEIADRVRATLGKNQTPKELSPRIVVDAVRKIVFEEYGFKGNDADYKNPDNSSLERVLATRKGLPIMLSHVVVAVARRLDVPIVGLPTPGRYIVKYDGAKAPAGFPKDDIHLHPYEGGRLLQRADLQQIFPGLNLDEPISPSTNREVLQRMLNNLQSHLFERNQNEKGYLAIEFSAVLDEHNPRKAVPQP